MTEIAGKIIRLRKETIAKIDRIHVLLLLSPSEELSKQLEYTESLYLSMLELLEDNMENEEAAVINRLTNDCETVDNLLNDIKEDLSKRFKLMPLLYLDKLKGEVLAYFYGKLEELLEQAGNLENLPSYINENSSDEIITFMQQLLVYVQEYASEQELRLIPLKYIEEHTNKVEFDLKKWMEFQKNVAFTLKYINCNSQEASSTMHEAFWLFELYYFVMISLCQ